MGTGKKVVHRTKRLKKQLKTYSTIILWSYGTAIALIVGMWLFAEIEGFPAYFLVADPAEIARMPPYIGALSNIGILLWCAAASVCFFTLAVLRNEPYLQKEQLFLKYSGSLTTLLLADDLFQIHENLAAGILGVSISHSPSGALIKNLLELIVYLFYFSIVVFYLMRFRGTLFNQSYSFFLKGAIGFMVFSTLVDFTPDEMVGHHILEEGLKFLGITSWLVYYVQFSIQILLHSRQPNRSS